LSKNNSLRVLASVLASLRWPKLKRAGSAGIITKNKKNTIVTTPNRMLKDCSIFFKMNVSNVNLIN
jgi:hypothetical protein